MKPNEAKRLIADALQGAGRDNKVSARTVSFSDLARADRVFVRVNEWSPDPLAETLERIGKENGFTVEFRGAGIIG